jgi:hypothetical protein
MKPEEKLDKILTYLYTEYEKENLKYEHSKSICHFAELKVNPTEAYMVLLKLNADGYVDMLDSNQWSFQINYNGILFCRSGGYEQELKDLKRTRFKNDIYNVMVAVGTSLAGLYAVWQIWIEISKRIC